MTVPVVLRVSKSLALQQGLTLLELLLASALSVILVALLLRCYGHLSTEQRQLMAAAELQQRGRFLSYYFSASHWHPDGERLQVGVVAPVGSAVSKGHARLQLCRPTSGEAKQPCSQYFLAKTSRRDVDGHRVRSLYVKRGARRRSELVADVVAFHWRVWQHVAHHWQQRRPEEVHDWAKVKIVELQFILRSTTAGVALQAQKHAQFAETSCHLRRCLHWVVDLAV